MGFKEGESYTYKILQADGGFKTGYTNGVFSFWAKSELDLQTREAFFTLPGSVKVISASMLTDETLARIPPKPWPIPDCPDFDSERHAYSIFARRSHLWRSKEPLMRALFRHLTICGMGQESRKKILNAPWPEWIYAIWVREDIKGTALAQFNFDTWEWREV